MRKLVMAGALAILAGLFGSAHAQTSRAPPTRLDPALRSSDQDDEATTDVDPALLRHCQAEAVAKNVPAAARRDFLRSCIEEENED